MIRCWMLRWLAIVLSINAQPTDLTALLNIRRPPRQILDGV